ncbi:MAG: alpha-mannosyltransferase [Rhodospirillales bacterium]|nr:alpha-mannosyltransferase [Rhodospirillales bacterium]
MKILFITDAWHPQINGVVRTLSTTGRELEKMGHTVAFIGPDQFRTMALPGYQEIRIAIKPRRKLERLIAQFQPQAIHIATEGPLGWAGRAICRSKGYAFTTSYHTCFPEYLAERLPVPQSLSYAVLRRFHGASSAVMVATPTVSRLLTDRGFANLKRWTRGVDTELFRPRTKDFLDAPRPISICVGRVAVEKNIEAFLSLDIPGTKYVVGGGPMLAVLKKRYPEVRFVGPRDGDELASYFAAADVFVFPSRTDTFGLVILEALASGVPVAAYPVQGPLDVIGDNDIGALDEDLGHAINRALKIDPERCRDFALTFSWTAAAHQFLNNVQPCI